MGVTKEKVKQMIRTVEGKTADKVKIRRVDMRKNNIMAHLTLTQGNQRTLVTKSYTKDVLCSVYAQRVKSQEHK